MLSFYLPQEDFAFAAPRCNRAGYSYGCRPSAGNPVAYKQQRCRSSEPAGSVIIKKCPEAALVTVKLPGATAEDIRYVISKIFESLVPNFRPSKKVPLARDLC